MNLTKIMKSLAAAALLCAGVSVAHADVVVIVSAKNPVGALSVDEASDIFLGKASAFPNGGPVTVLDLNEGAPARDEFYQKAVSKTPAQLKAYRAKLIFTGKGQPPRQLSDSEAVKKLVAENPGLIGYIDRAAVDSSVKTVLTVN